MFEDLGWLGLTWQEGPDVGGPFASYAQSERQDFYRAAWKRLADAGNLFPCTCSRRDLAEASQAPHEPDEEPIYPGTCRARRGAADEPGGWNWRFRVPDGRAIRFLDQNLGWKEYVAGRDFGDFVVWRRDNVPSYQLAAAVDDTGMCITEVVRGMDLLMSTARQLLVIEALGGNAPAYYHTELVKDAAGRRLAKRHDALNLRALRQAGLTPEEIRSAWQAGANLPAGFG